MCCLKPRGGRLERDTCRNDLEGLREEGESWKGEEVKT